MAGLVLNSSSVLRLNFCAKLNICASISATSPSREPLADIIDKQNLKKYYKIINIVNKTVLLLTLFFSSIIYSQVQHLNIGEGVPSEFIEQMNTFSPKNHPSTSTRKQMVWHSLDNIYLYGNDTSGYGDSTFWVYNTIIKQWKCIQSNNVNVNFGTKGVFNNTNTPGKRSQSITFVDNQGNLYLLGGNNLGNSQPATPLTDLWKFDVTLQQWAWIGGNNNSTGNGGNYGPIGVESNLFFPSSRRLLNPVLSTDGMIYIYGGEYHNSDRYDLWKYNPNNNAWTLLYYPSNNSQSIGNIGVEDINNKPGILIGYTSWFYNNNLYFFGGS